MNIRKYDAKSIALMISILSFDIILLCLLGDYLFGNVQASGATDTTRFTAYKVDDAINVTGDDHVKSGYILIDNETDVEYFCTTAVTTDDMTISSMCPLYNSDGTILTSTNSSDNKSKEV